MPKYAALVYFAENTRPAHNTPEEDEEIRAYGALMQELIQSGVMKAAEGFQPADTATTVRVRDGKTRLTDGPFAETEEQLNGFFVLDCKDLDEAVGWAAQIPNAAAGSIELRPITEG